MTSPRAKGEETERTRHLPGEGAVSDTVELRLPATSVYVPVLRATVGVVAGTMSFSYDEILHLRVAASEAFDLITRRLQQVEVSPRDNILSIRFVVGADGLEIVMMGPEGSAGPTESAEEEESRAVLRSLVDVVEIGDETTKGVRLVKRKSPDASASPPAPG
jgi:anti-sigma regulatory factor (Ser/Thr protein kinase)